MNELRDLALSYDEDGNDEAVQEDVKEIEKEITDELKPNLRMLSLYERYINVESKSLYTETIGLVEKAKALPAEYDIVLQKSICASKSLENILADE